MRNVKRKNLIYITLKKFESNQQIQKLDSTMGSHRVKIKIITVLKLIILFIVFHCIGSKIQKHSPNYLKLVKLVLFEQLMWKFLLQNYLPTSHLNCLKLNQNKTDF